MGFESLANFVIGLCENLEVLMVNLMGSRPGGTQKFTG